LELIVKVELIAKWELIVVGTDRCLELIVKVELIVKLELIVAGTNHPSGTDRQIGTHRYWN
jgi:hypothetical protein